MKKLKNNKMRKAFSLMELMVVIVIMGLLASIVLPNLIGKSDDAKQKLICVQMKSIAQAIKMYKLDNSSYPTLEEGLPVKYFQNNKLPKDSWGNDYIYILDEDKFDIISRGADKKESTDDDIYYSKCNK
jgi:general secretion pathway protein G